MTVIATHVDIASRAWLRSHGIRILVVLGVTIVASRLGGWALRRLIRRLGTVRGLPLEGQVQRATTLGQVASRTLAVIVWTGAFLTILGEVGVSLGPLIAGAGIAGVALGFGAQSLVRDILAGFFILLEDQFHIGEEVELSASGGGASGTVEAISLRVTTIRSGDGTLHFVPNGNIVVVANLTRGTKRERPKRKRRSTRPPRRKPAR